MKTKILFGIMLASAVVFAASDSVRTFYLKPGSAEGDGSEASPFGSFATAQKAVRDAVADASLPSGRVDVVVLDGKYWMDGTTLFTKEDSGTAKHPVRWRAKTKGGVRLSGGVPVPKLNKLSQDDPGWTRIPEEAREHVVVADLKASGIADYGIPKAVGYGGYYMELVWGGRFQTLARWPNDGYTGIAWGEDLGKDANGRRIPVRRFISSDDRPSRWVDEPAPYGNGFFRYNWDASRVAFKRIDPATKTIEHIGRGPYFGYSTNGFWFGYNILRELDRPGEYYIDREAGRLYYWPTTDGAAPEGEVTKVKKLFFFDALSSVTFEGLELENTRGYAIDATNGCHDVSIVGCTMRNHGRRAVRMLECRDCRIAGCDISWCGEGGIYVSGGDQDTLTHGNMVVDNCHIHHFSLLELTYATAVRLKGCGNSVTHCTIHDAPHTGLTFTGREHTISWNEMHSLCLDCGEIGAVYCGQDWTMCGNRIDANYFHDIYNPRDQRNRAIMIDDGGASITMTSNRFERVAEGICLSGIGNVIENNLFISNFPPISAWQKWEHHEDYFNKKYTHKLLMEHLAEIPVHEEPWKSRYPYLGMIDDAIKTGRMRDPATRTVIRCNYAINGTTNMVQHMGEIYAYSPETWLKENNVANSPTPPPGFAPLPPVSAIGVYESPERASWPVSHPVTIKCTNLIYKE